MTTDDQIEYTANVLAQYRCTHLAWGAAIWELADIGMPVNAIVLLLDYEDRKKG